MEAEDIHTFIEGELTKRIGDNGKRLHTSRSRNDQVALDVKLYLKKEVVNVKNLVVGLIKVIAGKAEEYADTVMPGYTHLQRAQPITFGHHLLAYGEMLLRDVSRLEDCLKRMDEMPLGSCALAGTTYPIDRNVTADLLGFDRITNNSLDGVSDGAAGNSSSSSLTMRSPQARRSCPRRRTPISRNLSAARAAEFSATQ